MRVFFRPLSALVALSLLAACSNINGTDNQPNRYAALNMAAQNNGSSGAKGVATMIFFQGVNVSVPNSAQQQFDQCIISAIDTATVVTTGMNSIGGGLSFTVGTRAIPLAYNSSLLRYETGTAQPFSYSSGESATITIPDAGSVFPASTLTLKLAEPISPAALSAPVANTDWVVRWNGTNDDVSSIQLQLTYATSSSATKPNEQVYCVLKDDGSVSLPAAYLTGFVSSPNALRSMRILRWRTNERVLDDNTLLHLASTVDTVVTFP